MRRRLIALGLWPLLACACEQTATPLAAGAPGGGLQGALQGPVVGPVLHLEAALMLTPAGPVGGSGPSGSPGSALREGKFSFAHGSLDFNPAASASPVEMTVRFRRLERPLPSDTPASAGAPFAGGVIEILPGQVQLPGPIRTEFHSRDVDHGFLELLFSESEAGPWQLVTTAVGQIGSYETRYQSPALDRALNRTGLWGYQIRVFDAPSPDAGSFGVGGP